MAAALDLHPSTLRNRLARIGELTGFDSRDPSEVAGAWWAVRARELSSWA